MQKKQTVFRFEYSGDHIRCVRMGITDVHVTPANVHDHEPALERLDAQQSKLGIKIQYFGADKGYDYPILHHGLQKLGIVGYIAPITSSYNGFGTIDLREFTYDEVQDIYRCPQDHLLTFRHLNRKRKTQSFQKVYAANTKDCKKCSLRPSCFGRSATRRTIARPLFDEVYRRNKERAKTTEYERVQRLRRIWCEGTFGTMKMHHNLVRTLKRGIRNVTEQCLLAALPINLKRMVKVMV